jgi:hypothetical protein
MIERTIVDERYMEEIVLDLEAEKKLGARR